MTITLDPQTAADLRAVAEERNVSIEAYLTEMIREDAKRLNGTDQSGPSAALVRNGHFLAISSPLPPDWDPVQAIEEIRAERDRKVLGL